MKMGESIVIQFCTPDSVQSFYFSIRLSIGRDRCEENNNPWWCQTLTSSYLIELNKKKKWMTDEA